MRPLGIVASICVLQQIVTGFVEGSYLAKKGDPVTIYCESDDQRYDRCTWTSPSGNDKCDVWNPDLRKESVCMEGAAAQLSSSSAEGTQCSMTISRLSQSDHGEWTCKLSLGSIQDDQETQVTVEVATPATVEFADKYGVVQVHEGTDVSYSCVAKHGRPSGVFKWLVVDGEEVNNVGNDASSSERILQVVGEPEVEPDLQDSFTVTQSVTYTPLVEDDGKILKCIYEQFDNEGNVLFEGNPKDQDEVELSVNFLEKTDPAMGPLERSAMEGQEYTITMEFGAKPKPGPEELTWLIISQGNQDEVQVTEMEYVYGDRYMVWPLKDSDATNNMYVAMLTIQGVQMSDGGNETSYALIVHQRDDRGNVIDTAEHNFILRVSEDPNAAAVDSRDVQVEGESSTVVIAVVVTLVLLVIIGAAIGVTIWAKKTGRWCFAPASQQQQPKDQHASIIKPNATVSKEQQQNNDDPEAGAPLKGNDLNIAPGLKPEFRRPTDL